MLFQIKTTLANIEKMIILLLLGLHDHLIFFYFYAFSPSFYVAFYSMVFILILIAMVYSQLYTFIW